MQRAWRAQPRAEPLVYRSKRRTSADASSAIASGIASTGKVVFLRAATGLQWPIHAYMRNCIFNLKTKKINSSKHLSFLETPSRSMASDAEMLMAVEERFDPHPRLPISRRDDVAGRRRACLPRGATVGLNIRRGQLLAASLARRRRRRGSASHRSRNQGRCRKELRGCPGSSPP